MKTELWASKSLDLAWLPPEPRWCSPALLHVPTQPPGLLRWHWRVDEVFAAWSHRMLQTAMRLGSTIPAETKAAYDVICAYLTELRPDCWPAVRALAANPVVLPGVATIADVVELARYGLHPKWDGWERDAAASEQAAAEPAKPAAVPKAKVPAKGRRKARDDGEKLF